MMRVLLVVVVLMSACGPRGHWPPRPSDHPATRAELGVYELTVRADSSAEREDFARALSVRGFSVVQHEPRKGHLEVLLTHEGRSAVATLRSDDWFVDEAVGGSLEGLAETLAVSQRVADFIRNSGLPQQHMIPDQ